MNDAWNIMLAVLGVLSALAVVFVVHVLCFPRKRKTAEEKDNYRVDKQLVYQYRDHELRTAKISIKTATKNHVILLEEIVSSYPIEVDLGPGRHYGDTTISDAEYRNKCIVQAVNEFPALKRTVNNNFDQLGNVFDSALNWLLSVPGTAGALVLSDNDEGTLQHSIRRQDVLSVRVVFLKKTSVKLKFYTVQNIIAKVMEQLEEMAEKDRWSRPPGDV
jgi:hypothetical protein